MAESNQKSVRLTTAQALVRFLAVQYVARDGIRHRFFDGCFGIFGHGNVAGMGQALQQYSGLLRYFQTRNEQAMVHTAAAYAKHSNRMRTLVCTTSIGPGATNMLTGAAAATVNRLPVLLLPGDIFARRNVAPVLQQVESAGSQDFSANDCFKPVSRYWDRISRPEQLITALPEALRVLTSPADTGAVTLALPEDVQTEAFNFPAELFAARTWQIPRARPDAESVARAAALIHASRRPLIIAGGGVHYSDATADLFAFAEQTGIPVAETMAGKGALRFDNPMCLGAVGATGTSAAVEVARDADLVIGIGTRYSDFTTASKTLFGDEDVRFININVAEFDAYKHAALPLVGDARATISELTQLLSDFRARAAHTQRAHSLHAAWEAEVDRIYAVRATPLPSQGEVIGAVNELGDPDAVMVCAAGSLPGDLHKLWRARHARQYHLEYGYSTMGYEIAGALGVKMAEPAREVYVMVGDGSYLMLSNEVITSIQEGYKLTIILLDNAGYKSIGALSRSLGQEGFGTRYAYRSDDQLVTDAKASHIPTALPVDLAMNARSLGAHVIEADSYSGLVNALHEAQAIDHTVVIYLPTDRYLSVPGYAWWDVPVAEVSEMENVDAAREEWAEQRTRERYFLRAD